jgi:hypothetical protein
MNYRARNPPLNCQRVTGDERCGLGAEPDGGFGNFLRRAHSTNGLEVNELLLYRWILARNPIDHLSVNDARTHGATSWIGRSSSWRCCRCSRPWSVGSSAFAASHFTRRWCGQRR